MLSNFLTLDYGAGTLLKDSLFGLLELISTAHASIATTATSLRLHSVGQGQEDVAAVSLAKAQFSRAPGHINRCLSLVLKCGEVRSAPTALGLAHETSTGREKASVGEHSLDKQWPAR